MKLSVSNLAWAQDADFAAGRLLSRLGVTGIEVAPTRIADWEALTPARLADYRKIWAGMGLAISSLQAIFFNRPQLQLLGDTSSFALMAEHMRRIGGIAQALGAGVAVFGAPNNRKRGQLAPAEAETLAAERLSQLGDIAAEHGLTIGLEPVPEVYNADVLTRAADILRMNDLCGHSHVRPHLDTACVGMAGDEIGQAIASAGSALAHYHAAEPNLGSFHAPTQNHEDAARALAGIGYSGWIALEMRQQEGDGLAAMEEAVRYVARIYQSA